MMMLLLVLCILSVVIFCARQYEDMARHQDLARVKRIALRQPVIDRSRKY